MLSAALPGKKRAARTGRACAVRYKDTINFLMGSGAASGTGCLKKFNYLRSALRLRPRRETGWKMNLNYSSKLLENAVAEFARLPGIGPKTALRMVLFMLRQEPEDVHRFSDALLQLKDGIKYCECCHNLSDTARCAICSDAGRDHSTVCVVESIRDVMSIENTMQYRGVYHVLGGVISPIDGVGPGDLTIGDLEERVRSGGVREVILALSTTMEGDMTNFYIYRKIKDTGVVVSTLARGVAVGDELEYADQLTLGRSIVHRTPFEDTFQSGNPA